MEDSEIDVDKLLQDINANFDIDQDQTHQQHQQQQIKQDQQINQNQQINQDQQINQNQQIKQDDNQQIVSKDKNDEQGNQKKKNEFTIVNDNEGEQKEVKKKYGDLINKNIEEYLVINDNIWKMNRKQMVTQFDMESSLNIMEGFSEIYSIYQEIQNQTTEKIVFEQKQIQNQICQINRLTKDLKNQNKLALVANKTSFIESKCLDLRKLKNDSNKSKYYLLNIIKKLELFEFSIDKLIDVKMKKNRQKSEENIDQ